MVLMWNLMEVSYLPQKWLRIHIYNSCAQPIKSPSPFLVQKFKDQIISATKTGTRLAWLSIYSIRSTTVASTYPGDYGNIRVPYTTNANMSMTRSSLLFCMMYPSRKSLCTHSFFPFNLVMGTKTLASILVICANFFSKLDLL